MLAAKNNQAISVPVKTHRKQRQIQPEPLVSYVRMFTLWPHRMSKMSWSYEN
jgi:hypothetical protein